MIPEASTLHQIFVPFILGGMVAGAAVVYSALRRVFFAFAIPALLPSIMHFYLIGDSIHFSMAAMLLLFLVLMIISVLRLHKVVVNSLSLRFENENLVADLTKGKELAEELNERLKLEVAVRKNAEDELQKHRQRLEQTIREKTVQLVRSNEQLSQEISERRQVEKSLREKEERYRNLFEYSNDCIFLHDLDGNIVDVNKKVADQFGISKSEVLDLNMKDFHPPDVMDTIRNAFEAIVKKGFINFETQFKKLSGEIFYAEVSSSLFTVGNTRMIQEIVRDVTDRKSMEKELQNTKEYLENVIENAVEAVGIVNLKGRFVLWNKRAGEIFGYSFEELKGKHYSIMYADQEVLSVLLKELKEKSIIRQVEMLMRRKDGHTVPMELSMNLLRDEDGNKIGSLCLAKDLREMKLMQAKLLHAAKMEAVGTLAGGIAHDFNNLLQAVQGYAELLLLDTTQSNTHYQGLQEIKRAAHRGAQLSRRLLTFSRKMDSQLRPLSLNDQIRETRNLLRRTIPKMIEIDCHLQEDLYPVNADPTQIEQILINFGLNAKDAMVEGGRILIETSNVLLDVDFCKARPEMRPGHFVLLSVSDTGVGMDKSTMQNIFDPFFSTKEVGKGTGLGLSLVYGIVKNHGGYIECQSDPGKGTRFEVYLPALLTPLEIVQSKDKNALRAGNETILIVDDEKSIRETVSQILSRSGYTVLAAEDGESALNIYQSGRGQIDLVILDVVMPGMGGRQCLEKLLEMNPDIKVIMTSGYSNTGPAKDILQGQIQNFISKPYQTGELLDTIRKVLDNSGESKTYVEPAISDLFDVSL